MTHDNLLNMLTETREEIGAGQLPPKIKNLWLSALRSGTYRQGQNALHPTQDCFCCLGVLFDVVQKDKGLNSWQKRITEGPKQTICYLADIPGYTWANLPTSWCVANEMTEDHVILFHKFAEANDSGLTFSEIANWIEANL